MERRIKNPVMGTEMEYCVYANRPDEPPDSDQNFTGGMAGRLFHQPYLPDDLEILGSFLSNGGRMYLDMCNHAEIATPEVKTLSDIVIYEMAADLILAIVLEEGVREGFLQHAALHRRVAAPGAFIPNGWPRHPITWGYHANFQIPRERFKDTQCQRLMAQHFATMNIFAGAGAVFYDAANNRGVFTTAQKATGLTCDASTDTVHQKPVINLRDEPHADTSARLHVTMADPHMSPRASMLQLGAIRLMTYLFDHPKLRQEAWAGLTGPFHSVAHQVAADLTLRQTVEYGGARKTIRPLDVQFKQFEAIRQLGEHQALTKEDEWVIANWHQTLCGLEQLGGDPLAAAGNPDLMECAEWIAKYNILNRQADKDELAPGSPERWQKLVELDHRWDLIRSVQEKDGEIIVKEGIGAALRKIRWAEHMPPDAQIQHAVTTPPADTRARVRGDFIRKVCKPSLDPQKGFRAAWDCLSFPQANNRPAMVWLPDPANPSKDEARLHPDYPDQSNNVDNV